MFNWKNQNPLGMMGRTFAAQDHFPGFQAWPLGIAQNRWIWQDDGDKISLFGGMEFLASQNWSDVSGTSLGHHEWLLWLCSPILGPSSIPWEKNMFTTSKYILSQDVLSTCRVLIWNPFPLWRSNTTPLATQMNRSNLFHSGSVCQEGITEILEIDAGGKMPPHLYWMVQ